MDVKLSRTEKPLNSLGVIGAKGEKPQTRSDKQTHKNVLLQTQLIANYLIPNKCVIQVVRKDTDIPDHI